jgi:hypothetical protein
MHAMDPVIVSASAAVLGSLVGGAATIATAWVTQTTQSRRQLMRAEIRKRELLYREFIAECSRLAVDAYSHELERPETVLPAYALLNRIKLTSSNDVCAAADRTVRRISEQYFARNMSLNELRELARSAEANPLAAFSEACRSELELLRKGA